MRTKSQQFDDNQYHSQYHLSPVMKIMLRDIVMAQNICEVYSFDNSMCMRSVTTREGRHLQHVVHQQELTCYGDILMAMHENAY